MNLISAKIYGFGCLKDCQINFENFTVFCQENGSGKSTMAAFIRSMFYGLGRNTAKDLALAPRKRYKSWQTDAFGGELTFEAGGEIYTVTRTFGSVPAKDTFAIIDARTLKKCPKFSENLGYEIFGLDEEAFARTVFLSGKTEIALNNSLSARLNNIMLDTTDNANCETAVDMLENKRGKNRNSGLYKDLVQVEGELAELRIQIIRAEEKEREVNTALIKVSELKKRYNAQLAEIKQTENLQQQSIEQRVVVQKIQNLNNLKREADKKHAELNAEFIIDETTLMRAEAAIDQLKIYDHEINSLSALLIGESEAAVTTEQPKKQFPIFLLMSTLMALAAAGLAFYDYIIAAIVGAIAVISLFFHFNQRSKIKTEKQVLAREREKIDISEAHRFELKHKSTELEKNKANVVAFLIAFLSPYYNDVNASNIIEKFALLKQSSFRAEKIREELRSMGQKIDEYIQAENLFELQDTATVTIDFAAKLETLKASAHEMYLDLSKLSAFCDHYYSQNDIVADLYFKQSVLTEKKAEIEKERAYLEQAAAFLTQAKDILSSNYIPKINKEFKKIWATFPPSRISEIEIDKNLNLYAAENNSLYALDYQSAGYQEILNVALRFALINVIFKKERPFIILDDPFVNLDEKRLNAAAEFVKNHSSNQQIIYLTCIPQRTL